MQFYKQVFKETVPLKHKLNMCFKIISNLITGNRIQNLSLDFALINPKYLQIYVIV